MKDVHPGAQLQAFATSQGQTFPISSLITATETEATIPVAPFLMLNSQVFVAEWACGDAKLLSNPQPPSTVQQPPPLTAPAILEPIISGTNFVDVTMYLPGAGIDVYVSPIAALQWTYNGHALATGLDSKTRVFLLKPVQLGDIVAATQSLCNQVSAIKEGYQVVPPPPQTPQIVFPFNDANNVPTKPTYVWQDPGAGTDARATAFYLQVLQGNNVITGWATTLTSITLPNTLTQSNQYSWRVRGSNTTGSSQFAAAMFSTAAPPPPPKPKISINPSQPSNTFAISGQGFKPNDAVHFQITISKNFPWVADLRSVYAATTADASGNITSFSVDLVQLCQSQNLPLNIPDNQGGYTQYYGAYSGEHVALEGIDSRAGGSYASQWASNVVSYTAS